MSKTFCFKPETKPETISETINDRGSFLYDILSHLIRKKMPGPKKIFLILEELEALCSKYIPTSGTEDHPDEIVARVRSKIKIMHRYITNDKLSKRVGLDLKSELKTTVKLMKSLEQLDPKKGSLRSHSLAIVSATIAVRAFN